LQLYHASGCSSMSPCSKCALICVCAFQINRPFSALDVGLVGQNIWSMRPFEYSSNEDVCRKSALLSNLPASFPSFGAPAPVQPPPLDLWDFNGNSLPLMDNTLPLNALPATEIDRYPSGGGLWNDLRLQPYPNEHSRQDLDILATLCKLLAEN